MIIESDDGHIKVVRGDVYYAGGFWDTDGSRIEYYDCPLTVYIGGELLAETFSRVQVNLATGAMDSDFSRVQRAVNRALEKRTGGSIGRIAWK